MKPDGLSDLTAYVKKWISFKNKFSAVVLAILLLYFYFPYGGRYLMVYQAELLKDELRNKAAELTASATTKEEAVLKIMYWENQTIRNVYNRCIQLIWNICIIEDVPPSPCVRLVGDVNPAFVLYSKCGACWEYVSVFNEMSNAVNIPSRIAIDMGEDHNWDEILINGAWVTVDPSIFPNKIGVEASFYDKERAKADGTPINVSYVYIVDEFGNEIDLTNKYTDTGKLVVHINVSDSDTENTTVFIGSNALFPNTFTGASCTVAGSGTCEFNLGGNNYTVTALKGNFLKHSDRKIIKLDENSTLDVVLTPNKLDVLTSVPEYLAGLIASLVFWVLYGMIFCVVKYKFHSTDNSTRFL